MVKISVSILSKNDLATIEKLNKTDADYFHIDVMDGKFVNNIQFPIFKINEISEIANKPLDVHLMVDNPNTYIDELNISKIQYLTVHYEILKGDLDIIKKIKNKGIKCGLSVKPITDIRDIFYLLDSIDLILVMSVEPGYGGQRFLEPSLDKVKVLREECERRHLNPIISIDGGINNLNSRSCAEVGCDMLVSGSYIVNSSDYQASIDSLR